MKIVHITAVAGGGAGIACLRQHHAMRAAGMDSNVLLFAGDDNARDHIISLEKSDPEFGKLLRKYRQRRAILNIKVRVQGRTPELFSDATSLVKMEDHPLVQSADIIHLHWVSGVVDLQRFFARINKPVVWTLHDAWPYTGGFHYERYWNSEQFAGFSQNGLALRKKIFAERNIQLIFPSDYLLQECTRSNVFAKGKFHHVLNCIESGVGFHSEKQNEIAGKYWVYCADELDYKRKGAELLFEAFQKWNSSEIKLVVAGKAGKMKLPAHPQMQFMGHLSPDKMQTLILQASGIVHPSLEDNQPNVITEALVQGVPVLATPAGGVPEMITTGFNGILTTNFRVDSLVEGLEQFSTAKFDTKRISEDAEKKYSPEVFVEKIKKIYASC
jgi:glycosyltransferase involved in cell wall biosynthesis